MKNKQFNIFVSIAVTIELPCEDAFDAKLLVKNIKDNSIQEAIIDAATNGDYEICDVEKA